MKKSKLLRQLFQSTFITMFGVELANTVSCVVDGLVTSRYLGSAEMAAYGIAAPYFSIAAIVSGILMVGAQTVCAKCVGSGDRKGADQAFSTVAISATGMSLVLSLLGVVFSDQIAMLFGARGEYSVLLPYTSQYLKGLFLGTPCMVLLAVLAPIVQLDGGAKRANLSSIVVTVVDIAADLIGVLVLKGGLLMIAVSTSLSYLCAAAVLLPHFFRKDSSFHLRLRDYSASVAGEIIRIGLPRGASMLCRAIGPILINTLVLRISATVGMTAMSVQSNVKFLLSAPACGISGAALLLSSLYVGERDRMLLKETMVCAFKYACLLMGGLAGLTILFANSLSSFYLPADPAAAKLAASAIRYFALSLPLVAINLSLANYLQAFGKNIGAYLINIGSELVCTVSCVYLLSRFFALNGVWAAYPAGQLLLSLLYLSAALLHKGKNEKPGDRLLFLKGFGVSDDNRISASLKNQEEVTALSIELAEFCKARGVSSKRSYLVSLFVDELAGNVIEHGFSDGKKHQLEAVVTIDSEDIIIHIRDDCSKFDLKEKAANWRLNPEHPEQNIGIRLVLGMAKEVSYAGTMNTNNVVVKI